MWFGIIVCEVGEFICKREAWFIKQEGSSLKSWFLIIEQKRWKTKHAPAQWCTLWEKHSDPSYRDAHASSVQQWGRSGYSQISPLHSSLRVCSIKNHHRYCQSHAIRYTVRLHVSHSFWVRKDHLYILTEMCFFPHCVVSRDLSPCFIREFDHFFFFFFFCSLFSFWPTAAVLTATQRLQKHTRSSLKKKYRYLPTTSNGSLKQRPWAGNVLLLRICSSIVGRAARFNFIHISRLLSKAPFLPARVSLPACFRLVTSSTSLRSLPLPSVIRTDRLKSVLWCWEGSMQCRKIKIIHKFASHSCKNQLNHSNRVFVLCYFPPLQLHRC